MTPSKHRSGGPVDPPTERELEVWHRASIRRIASGFAALAGVIIFGVLGYLNHGWSFFDSLFMVVITISGVGFGEVRPMESTGLRIHTMMVIALGLVAVAYTLGGFVQYLTEGKIRN